MDLHTLAELTYKPYYTAGVVVTAFGVGALVGIAVDKLTSKKEDDGGQPEGEWWKDAFDSDGDGDMVSYPPSTSEFPPIPEGVNEVPPMPDADKVVNDELFMKPDISRMVDYTKYRDQAKNYNTMDLKEKGMVVMPDDAEATEDYDDDRFELIDEQDFVKGVGNGDGYVSATGTYFTQEKVLAGWNDDLTEKDVANTVGWRAIRMFDSPDVKAVYVRNAQLKVLYEIVRCDDPMEEVIQESIKVEIDKVQEE